LKPGFCDPRLKELPIINKNGRQSLKILFIFPLLGPNRYADTTLVQALFEFSTEESAIIAGTLAERDRSIISLAASLGLGSEELEPGSEKIAPEQWFAAWFNRLSLALQRRYGHRVDRQEIRLQPERRRVLALFEHEDTRIGRAAAELALGLMGKAMPDLRFTGRIPERDDDLSGQMEAFAEQALSLVLPADTEALIEAAKRRDVPVIKLERAPFVTVQGDFRIRMNSMLMLGHAAHREVLDGNFSLVRSGRAVHVIKDQAIRQRVLGFFKFPTETSGRPPTVGGTYRLIVANHRLVGVYDESSQSSWEGAVNDGLKQKAEQASRELRVGLMLLRIRTPDLSAPLDAVNGRALDLEVAPELDRFLNADSPLMRHSMEAFLDWLIPAGADSRIPVLAVTGSNGKTTTSHMMARILEATGLTTGLVNTDGRFLAGEHEIQGDQAAMPGHHRLFEDPRTEAAILEMHHRGMAEFGFPFRSCSIAACTNVTEEHLGTFGLETVKEMAGLKGSLLERARDGAVINADDPHCLAMLPRLTAARVALFSSTQGRQALQPLLPEYGLLCVLEERGGEDWMMLIDGDDALPVLPVRAMPCSFDGAARFNIENAMTAAACAYLHGVSPAVIAGVLGTFQMGFKATRGRLNHYENLPFTAIMDFAHSPDGIRRLSEFAARLPVEGRRILLFAAPGDRSNRHIRLTARRAAGHFDHYVCRHYPAMRGREAGEVAALLRDELLQCGVAAEQITTSDDPQKAIQAALALAAPEDLVLLTVSRREFDDTHAFLTGLQASSSGADPQEAA
jgi:UDP-N-acetylmuramyl tripeptide synthase